MLTIGFRFSQNAGMASKLDCAVFSRNLLHFAHTRMCFSSFVSRSGERSPTTADADHFWNLAWRQGDSLLASSPSIVPSL